jgi:hypothetical protein
MGTRAFIVCSALAMHGAMCSAADLVYVWTQPPGELQGRQWIEENARWLAQQYPRSARTWAATMEQEISFVVTSRTDFVPGSCDEVPIRVKMRQGRAVSVEPLKATQSCNSKTIAKLAVTESLLLTPDSMFKRISESVSSMKGGGSDCIQASFDASTGIPLRLQGGCPNQDDGGWRTVVSNIERKNAP